MKTGFDLARERGVKNAVALCVGKTLFDLSSTLDKLSPLTQGDESAINILLRDAPPALELIRHSTAHLLANAVKELYPEAQVTIGPTIDNGFYYDFAFRPFTPDDLVAIEKRMKEIAERNIKIERLEWSRDEAVAYFKKIGENYKAEIITSIPADQTLSLYKQGDFIDLCRGPHVPSTATLKVFKLTKVAGAYWRGDSKNEMLQRIYGTAWASKEDQALYLHMLEEAEKRDHRRLGAQLDLYHMQDDAPGMVFWHPKGWLIWQQVEQYLRTKLTTHGYQEVRTPQIVDRSFWEKSGHWENYHDNMYTTEVEEKQFAIKPMNCPCHIMIFNQGIKSYRDLPLRLSEFGACHRFEPSGALHGLMRVRGFTQDDAHIFISEDQLMEESKRFIALLLEIYRDFGFTEVIFKLSTRPAKRIGSDDSWDKAEAALAEALSAQGIKYTVQAGEGAFYGPKIEFTLKDSIGRMWQCGTLQVDYNLPQRLGARYMTPANTEATPVMLHRAIVGSMERFIGILIEHYAGAMPTWLAPEQVILMNISQAQADYTQSVATALQNMGIRAAVDLRNEKITYKIREHSLKKIPYLAVIGNREMETHEVALRGRGNVDLGVMAWKELAHKILEEVTKKSLHTAQS